MKLSDFINMVYVDDCDLTFFVFENEAERDSYRKDGATDVLLFAVKSPYVASYYLKEKFANANVKCMVLVSANIIDVVIDLEE